MLPDAARSPLAWAARWLRAVRQLPAPGSQAGSAFYRLVRAALEAIGERAASLGCALWAVFCAVSGVVARGMPFTKAWHGDELAALQALLRGQGDTDVEWDGLARQLPRIEGIPVRTKCRRIRLIRL